MSFEPNDDLQRAKASLTIERLCEYAGRSLQKGRDGKFFSPFREERTASFSLSREGRVWCDFGGGPDMKGGAWELAEHFWPNASKQEIAKHLIEASGIIIDDRYACVAVMPGEEPRPPSGFAPGPIFRVGNMTGVGHEDDLPDCAPL